jgi:hypothetical protein
MFADEVVLAQATGSPSYSRATLRLFWDLGHRILPVRREVVPHWSLVFGKRRESSPGTGSCRHVSGTTARGYKCSSLLGRDSSLPWLMCAGSRRLLHAHRSSFPALASSSDTITSSRQFLQCIVSNHAVDFRGICKVVGNRRPSSLTSRSAQTQIGDRACTGDTEARHAATPHRFFVSPENDTRNIPLLTWLGGHSSRLQSSPLQGTPPRDPQNATSRLTFTPTH